MSSYRELALIPGAKVRIDPDHLPAGQNPREVFMVLEGPAHDHSGAVVLQGLLTNLELTTTTATNFFIEIIKE